MSLPGITQRTLNTERVNHKREMLKQKRPNKDPKTCDHWALNPRPYKHWGQRHKESAKRKEHWGLRAKIKCQK